MTTTVIIAKENGFAWNVTFDNFLLDNVDLPRYRTTDSYDFSLTILGDTFSASVIYVVADGVDNAKPLKELKCVYTCFDHYKIQIGTKTCMMQNVGEETVLSLRSQLFGYDRAVNIASCTVEVSWEPDVVPVHFESTKCFESSLALLNYHSSMVNNPKFTDVTLKVRGTEIRAHKMILCACSDVFEAMFTHDTAEGQTGCVEIQDFDEQTIKGMVNFMYTRDKPILTCPEEAQELYKASNKYNVSGLKKACGEYFSSKLEEDNAMDCLQFADVHGDEKLKHIACRYIYNHPKCTENAEKWNSICQNPRLCQYLYQYKASHTN